MSIFLHMCHILHQSKTSCFEHLNLIRLRAHSKFVVFLFLSLISECYPKNLPKKYYATVFLNLQFSRPNIILSIPYVCISLGITVCCSMKSSGIHIVGRFFEAIKYEAGIIFINTKWSYLFNFQTQINI